MDFSYLPITITIPGGADALATEVNDPRYDAKEGGQHYCVEILWM